MPAPPNDTGKSKAIPHIEYPARPLDAHLQRGKPLIWQHILEMALSYAQFINPVGGATAIKTYKEKFRPSDQLSTPMANAGIFAFCRKIRGK